MTGSNFTVFQELQHSIHEVVIINNKVDDPPRLRDLVKSLQSFSRVIAGLQILLEKYRIDYPKASNVWRPKVDECLDFIRTRRSNSVLRAVVTRDSKKAKKLNDTLLIEVRKILEFILVSSLQPNLYDRTLSNHAVDVSRQGSVDLPLGELPPDENDIAQAIRDLVILRNSYNRSRNFAVINSNQGNLLNDPFESRMRSIWSQMCILGGISSEDGHQVPIPRQLLNMPSQHRTQITINAASESRHSSLSRPSVHSHVFADASETYFTPSDRSSTSLRRNTYSTTDSSSYSRANSASSSSHIVIPLQKPVQASYRTKDRHQKIYFTALCCYTESSRLRKLVWRSKAHSVVLEQRLRESSLPRTFHTSSNPAMHVHVIGNRNSDIELFSPGNLPTHGSIINYVFQEPSDMKAFQEVIRSKRLINSFEVDEILSDTHPYSSNHNKCGLTVVDQLKIWRSDRHYSLSFFANRQDIQQDIEYYLESFKEDVWEYNTRNHKTVKLHFSEDNQNGPGMLAKKWISIQFTTNIDCDIFVREFKDALKKDSLPPESQQQDISPLETPNPETPQPNIPPLETLHPETPQQDISPLETLNPESQQPEISPLETLNPNPETPQPEVLHSPISPMTSNRRDSQSPNLLQDVENARQADEWMKYMKNHVHLPYFPPRDDWNTPNGPKRVKVAIVDTGVKFPQGIEHIYEDQLKECRSWLNSDTTKNPDGMPFEWLADGDGDGQLQANVWESSGTHLAGLILEVAPHVELYVARVFVSQQELQSSGHDSKLTQWRIAQAIRYAVATWKVDIISMSFGFEDESDEISRAFNQAISAEPNKVLLLAAAHDFRAGSVLSWPARSSRAIGIYNLTGNRNKYPTTPNPQEFRPNFAILGVEVSSWWPLSENKFEKARISGTSVATAIAAGVAALILEIVRRAESVNGVEASKMEKLKQLADFEKMSKIFEFMSIRAGEYRFITPWKLFTRDTELSMIVHNIYESMSG